MRYKTICLNKEKPTEEQINKFWNQYGKEKPMKTQLGESQIKDPSEWEHPAKEKPMKDKGYIRKSVEGKNMNNYDDSEFQKSKDEYVNEVFENGEEVAKTIPDSVFKFIAVLESKTIGADDNVFIRTVYDSLGWQGGTIHQVVAEIKRLKEIDDKFNDATNCIGCKYSVPESGFWNPDKCNYCIRNTHEHDYYETVTK